jgi:hypothetical protein
MQHLAGHEACVPREEMRYECGHVLRASDLLQRVALRRGFLLEVRIKQRAGERGIG